MTRLYLVEDESLLRDFIKDMLSDREGFEVVGDSPDAESALVACPVLMPDMLITDVRLPGMDGVDLVRRLRDGLPDLHVLLLSGSFSLSVIRRALLARVDGILEKNGGLPEMEKAIEAVAAGHTYYGDAVLRSMPELVSGKAEAHPLESLTDREREVLSMIAEGFSTKDIAVKLDISARTADVHRMHIMGKLDAHNVATLTRIAIAAGLVDLPVL